MRPWMGLIALLHIETIDRRIVDQMTWDTMPLPLVSLRQRQPIGLVTSVRVVDGNVYANGWIEAEDLMTDRYAVGVDLDDAELAPETTGFDVLRIIDSNLRGLSVCDEGSKPAWPECHIRVLR